jgi:ABC-type amino acid transport substrate-binding protein
VARETPPYFFRQGSGIGGFEHDILAYYAKASGRSLEVRWVDRFEELLPALERGEADLAAGTFTITPERSRRFSFSSPYLWSRGVLVEPRSLTTTRLDQLRGSALATVRGSVYESVLSQVPDVTFVHRDRIADLLAAVAAGKARAAAVDSMLALPLLRDYPTLKLSLPLSKPEGLGFAMPAGSPLAAKVSRSIDLLRGSTIYYRLIEKHFGENAAALVTRARRLDEVAPGPPAAAAPAQRPR